MTLPNDVIKIPLTKGKFALIDPCDAEMVLRNKWYALFSRGKWYATRWLADESRHPKTGRRRRRRLMMHVAILQTPLGMDTDHRDGDGLNNTRGNLRMATRSQNQANMLPRKGCRFKGIKARGQKFYAYIGKDGKRKHLGTFSTMEDAARAYDTKAIELYGEFARLNLPEDDKDRDKLVAGRLEVEKEAEAILV